MAIEEREYVVGGMTCGHCEASVREEVGEVPGVTAVTADHESGRVHVSGSGIDEAAIREAVHEAGYTLEG